MAIDDDTTQPQPQPPVSETTKKKKVKHSEPEEKLSQYEKIKHIKQQYAQEKQEIDLPAPDFTNPEVFKRYKHHILPTKENFDDYKSLIDNVDMPEQQKIKEYITLVKPGMNRICSIDRINAQVIQIRDEITRKYDLKTATLDKKTKQKEKYIVKQYFTNVPPSLEYDTTAGKTKVRIMHFAYEDEPFTRSWFEMQICDHEKKWEKLQQLGVVIRDDDLDTLCKYFVVYDEAEGGYIYDEEDVARNIYLQSPTGFVVVPEWAGYDIFAKPRIKFNIEDITYMKEEMYHMNASDTSKEFVTAMAEDPYAKKRKDEMTIIFMFLVGFVVTILGIIYFLAGHLH